MAKDIKEETAIEPKETKAEDQTASAVLPEESTADESAKKPAPKRKKVKKNVPSGQVHILASFNNTIITVTDPKGAVLANSSAGACGFRGSKKGTAYAAQVAAERALATAKQAHGLTKADVYIKGVGLGREAAIRTLATQDIQVSSISDKTGIPHGGVRPRKAKRN